MKIVFVLFCSLLVSIGPMIMATEGEKPEEPREGGENAGASLKDYCQRVIQRQNKGENVIFFPDACRRFVESSWNVPRTDDPASRHKRSEKCSCDLKFVMEDFKPVGVNSTRYKAQKTCLTSGCRVTSPSGTCKCNVQNLVKKNDTVYQDYEHACSCRSQCADGTTLPERTCGAAVELISDDADEPENTTFRQPKLVRKFANCACDLTNVGGNPDFKCTCT